MDDIVVDINELDNELETLGGREAPAQQTKPEVPDKFRDVDKDTVVKSYMELEKKLGQQANEIGELRKFTDTYLRQELERVASPKKETKPEVRFEDLVENPGDAVSRAVEPKLREVDDRLAKYERELAVNKLREKHGDFNEIVSSPEFADFVKKSPYRMKKYAAANAYDIEAADDLFSEYKEHREFIKNSVEGNQRAKRESDLRAVAMESSSTGQTQRKIYRRSDLVNLRVNNPAKYEAMADEIMAAYSEGRVK